MKLKLVDEFSLTDVLDMVSFIFFLFKCLHGNLSLILVSLNSY